MIATYLTIWQHLRLSRKNKKLYYRTPLLVCKNCQRTTCGYVVKSLLVTDLDCPHCDSKTLIQEKKVG